MFPLALVPSITFTLRHPPRPAWHSAEVHVWSPADHLCLLHFTILSRDTLSEREGETCRAGGVVCHENPGLCNLWTCPARLWGAQSVTSHHSCTHIWKRCKHSACLLTLALCSFLSLSNYSFSSTGLSHCAVFFQTSEWFLMVRLIDVTVSEESLFSLQRWYELSAVLWPVEARLAFNA